MITFFSTIDKSVKTPIKMSDKMPGKIFELIKKNPKITALQLSKKTNLSVRTIERNIKILKTQNKINRIGPGNGTHWEIIE